jgi:hypothetical protein
MARPTVLAFLLLGTLVESTSPGASSSPQSGIAAIYSHRGGKTASGETSHLPIAGRSRAVASSM